METVRNPRDEAIIGRDARERPAEPFDQPNTDARGRQGDLEIEFECEMFEEGGEA